MAVHALKNNFLNLIKTFMNSSWDFEAYNLFFHNKLNIHC